MLSWERDDSMELGLVEGEPCPNWGYGRAYSMISLPRFQEITARHDSAI